MLTTTSFSEERITTTHRARLVYVYGDGDVEVRRRQHLRPAAFKPLPHLRGVALRAAAIATRVPGELRPDSHIEFHTARKLYGVDVPPDVAEPAAFPAGVG